MTFLTSHLLSFLTLHFACRFQPSLVFLRLFLLYAVPYLIAFTPVFAILNTHFQFSLSSSYRAWPALRLIHTSLLSGFGE